MPNLLKLDDRRHFASRCFPRQFIYSMIVVLLCTLPARRAFAADQGEPREDYMWEYRDATRDVIVGKILGVNSTNRANPADSFQTIRLRALSDLRGTIVEGTEVSIRVDAMLGSNTGYYYYRGSVGQIGVIFVRRGEKLGDYEFLSFGSYYPFGVAGDRAFIIAKDAPLLAAAFKEMRENLSAPIGVGMSKERARQLLRSKNAYLWSLASQRLVQQAEKADVDTLIGFFSDPNLTPEQALFLNETLNRSTGDLPKPSQQEDLWHFTWFLQSHAEAQFADEARPLISRDKSKAKCGRRDRCVELQSGRLRSQRHLRRVPQWRRHAGHQWGCHAASHGDRGGERQRYAERFGRG